MRRFLVFLTLLLRVFSQEWNYAPKIENSLEEKPLVVIIPSYNNEKFYERNLKSVFSQNYKNFRVIYTNDSSTDRTGELVLQYAEQFGEGIDFTYIETKKNGSPMSSIYLMVQECQKEEVVLILDGDDRFYNNDVLKRVNQAYLDDHVWMTYGSDYCRFKKRGHSRATPTEILRDNTFRTKRYCWSHLRTFYAGLFQCVEESRWKYQGDFYPFAGDIAIICNLFDLARDHVYFIEDILYDYNVDNPLNEFRLDMRTQFSLRKYIMALPPLEKLHSKDDFLL
jgi:glycosyltransferase involved in cell wall biosynthesis